MSASASATDRRTTSEGEVTVTLQQQVDYRFEVRFDSPLIAPLITDEPEPLGAGAGPNPTGLLTAAVANCLGASLLFALRKFKNDPGSLRAVATARLVRTEDKRLRVGDIEVQLHLGVSATALTQLERALAQFEQFCVVTQSVRTAIAVRVRVLDASDRLLHDSSDT